MHSIMPIEPTDRIECAIQVVDTNVINTNPVLIFAPISRRGLNCALSIDRDPWPGGVSMIRCDLALWLTHGWKPLWFAGDAPPPMTVRGPDRIGWQHKARVTEMLADLSQWPALLMLTDNIVQREAPLKWIVSNIRRVDRKIL
jgi:hypothetical protein